MLLLLSHSRRAVFSLPSLSLSPHSHSSRSRSRSFVNKVQLLGRVASDPEFRSFEILHSPPNSTKQVARGVWSFRLAVNRWSKSPSPSSPDPVKETSFFPISDYQNSDKWMYCVPTVCRGATVYVEGRVRVRKDAQSDKTFHDIIADRVVVTAPPKTRSDWTPPPL